MLFVTTQVSPLNTNYSKWPKMLAMAYAILDCNIDFLDSLQNYFQLIRSEQTDDRFLISVSSLDCKNTKRKFGIILSRVCFLLILLGRIILLLEGWKMCLKTCILSIFNLNWFSYFYEYYIINYLQINMECIMVFYYELNS
jgi:hypothetical protein